MNKDAQADMQTQVYGKWILAGEHAVLRGSPAIIFPVKEKKLQLYYWESQEDIRADFTGEYADEMQLLFWSVIERAVENLNIHHSQLRGHFRLENAIPVGAGMGASAALCVAISRWFAMRGFLPMENLHEFARQLENLFHNESSGADIAVAIAGEGIYFSRRGGLHSIKPQWQPHWYLSYSDKVSATARCVKKVKAIWDQDPKLAQIIDDEMAHAVSQAEIALQTNSEEGLPLLKQAIDLAQSCFKRWGLMEGNVERHIHELVAAGALAAKPTGSGDGGYVISLWKAPPPANLGFVMLPV